MRNNFSFVKEIWQEDDKTLGIIWTDEKKSFFDVLSLRRNCPCASCVDENTGKKILQDNKISEKVRPKKINSLGSYALNIHFNDGHKTGIYTFKKLRQMSLSSSS